MRGKKARRARNKNDFTHVDDDRTVHAAKTAHSQVSTARFHTYRRRLMRACREHRRNKAGFHFCPPKFFSWLAHAITRHCQPYLPPPCPFVDSS